MNRPSEEEALKPKSEESAMKQPTAYEAPKVITLGSDALSMHLGPSLSCTGFGGSASGC